MNLRVPGLDTALDALDRRLRDRAQRLIEGAAAGLQQVKGSEAMEEANWTSMKSRIKIADAIRDVRP